MINNLSEYPYLIIGFLLIITFILVLDLGFFNKKYHIISNQEALISSVIWIGLAMGFSVLIYKFAGVEKFTQFQVAYWIEKSLSIDNLFVFVLILNFFNVPNGLHHKVLFYGVIGALIMRGLFIFIGIEVIKYTFLPPIKVLGKIVTINYLLTIFGISLMYTAIKSWFLNNDVKQKLKHKNFISSPGAKFISLFFNFSKNYDKDKFFTLKNGKKLATPLLIVISVVEFTDLIFALDSIPAIFSIAPNDSMILYTSNIFAILGLRSLYFLLVNFMKNFSKLKYGISIILFFIGFKMIISPVYHVDSIYFLVFIGLVIISSSFISMISKNR